MPTTGSALPNLWGSSRSSTLLSRGELKLIKIWLMEYACGLLFSASMNDHSAWMPKYSCHEIHSRPTVLFKPQNRIPEPRVRDSKVHISTHLQHISVEMCVRALGAAFPVSLGPLFYNSANMGYRFPVRCVSHTNTCLHHLPQITPSYFSHPWEKKKIQAISSGSQRKQFGSGRLLGLKKRARAPTRRVHFASILIWARTNG